MSLREVMSESLSNTHMPKVAPRTRWYRAYVVDNRTDIEDQAEVEALNLQDARNQLRGQGYTVLYIERV